MQVIGVTEQGNRLPLQPLQRFQYRLLGAEVVRVRVECRMRQHDHLGARLEQQRPQVGQEVVPGWRAIGIRWQRERIELAEQADIRQLGLAGRHRAIRRCLHGRQLQTEVPQLHTARLGNPGPTRHRDAVPGPQPALDPRRIGTVHAHLPVMLGLDLARGQRDDPGFVGLAVQTEGGQFGIVGMGAMTITRWWR